MARSKQKTPKKPAVNASWGGRFSEPTDAAVARFSASVGFDSRLWRHDIQGSMAHALMLGKQGILRREEAAKLVEGLGTVAREIESGRFEWKDSLEDVHMNVEARLRELLGPVAGKLHTARSRNDQVATDVRLYLRDQLDAMRGEIRGLQAGLVDLAEGHVGTVMPGFTHMQPAQPISLAHHLLAWFEMLERDHERLGDVRKRLSSLPLGAGALAGTTFPIDREMVARQLGFDRICENSLDAVADRDFAIELAAACALVMTHLSRMSEELVLWASPLFGFVDLPDAFCTGSSIMPQKKNPDVPELVRGKAGRVFGALTALLTLMKGLPLAYNRDMQEDKEPIFDAVATTRACLDLFARLVPGMEFRTVRLAAAARDGYATATDLADYLVVKGVPFREAHEIVGRTVRGLIAAGKRLDEASAAELRAFDPRIGDDVVRVLTVEASVTARKARGGTSFATVRKALAKARRRMRAKVR